MSRTQASANSLAFRPLWLHLETEPAGVQLHDNSERPGSLNCENPVRVITLAFLHLSLSVWGTPLSQTWCSGFWDGKKRFLPPLSTSPPVAVRQGARCAPPSLLFEVQREGRDFSRPLLCASLSVRKLRCTFRHIVFNVRMVNWCWGSAALLFLLYVLPVQGECLCLKR